MNIRAAAWLAWFLWGLCVAFAVLAVLIAYYTPPLPQGGPGYGILLAVAFLAYPTVGALVASRRPKNPVGWILCGVGLLLGSQGFAVAYAGYALTARPGWVPGGKIALWVSGWFDFPMLFLAAALLILLFPEGRLPDRRWRVVPWLAVGGSVLATLRYATNGTGPFFFYTPIRNPIIEVGGALGVAVDLLGRLGLAALFGVRAARECSGRGAPADKVVRLRRHGASKRRFHFARSRSNAGGDRSAMGSSDRDTHLSRPLGCSRGRRRSDPAL